VFDGGGGGGCQAYLLPRFLSNDTVVFTFFCFRAIMLAHFIVFPFLTVYSGSVSQREVRSCSCFRNFVAKDRR
jgi:hypothetical protein